MPCQVTFVVAGESKQSSALLIDISNFEAKQQAKPKSIMLDFLKHYHYLFKRKLSLMPGVQKDINKRNNHDRYSYTPTV